jgi:polyhydroxybutyrate depolymerase
MRLAKLLAELAAVVLVAATSPAVYALESAKITVAGVERSYVFQKPQHLRNSAPLLIALHDAQGSGSGMATFSKFAAIADEKGFIAVFPDGIDKQWNDGRAGISPADDVAFIDALITVFVSRKDADPSRVYITGIANGGMMSFRLACELPKRVAAIAVVAASLPRVLEQGCSNGPPLPVMIIDGTADPMMPWAGGELAGNRAAVLSATATAQLFALRIGSPVETVEPLPSFANADPTRVKRHRWRTGSGPEVVLYEVEGGGHAWPGGPQYLPESVIGRVSRQIDASREVAGFLLRFRLP